MEFLQVSVNIHSIILLHQLKHNNNEVHSVHHVTWHMVSVHILNSTQNWVTLPKKHHMPECTISSKVVCVAVWVARFSLSWLNMNSELQQPMNIDHAIMQLPSQQVFFHIKTWAIIMGVNWMIRAMKTTTFLHYFIWHIWCHFFTYIMDNVSIPGYTNKRSLSFITFMTHLYCQELMSAAKECLTAIHL